MRKLMLIAGFALIAVACGGDDTSSGSESDDTEAQSTDDSASTDADTDDSASTGDETTDADTTTCPDLAFSGWISSDGDDNNTAFSLNDDDVVLAQAFALSPGANYTVYLADYDLGDQVVGADTIEAAEGQIVVTVALGTPDGEPIVIGEPYDATFVIMDSGGGASGFPDDPMGTAIFTGVTDDRVCFDYEFSDTGQELSGSISAEVVGGF
jgi:hypothetical protein